MKCECITKCFYNNRLYIPGEPLVVPGAKKAPAHFKEIKSAKGRVEPVVDDVVTADSVALSQLPVDQVTPGVDAPPIAEPAVPETVTECKFGFTGVLAGCPGDSCLEGSAMHNQCVMNNIAPETTPESRRPDAGIGNADFLK